MRSWIFSWIGILVFVYASQAFASSVDYHMSVDTSSISGEPGSFDFNFNPGPLVTQSASLQILGFSGHGTLNGGPTLTGDVTGAFPATLTFDNGSGFNDYFQGFTFGTALTFNISLYGPALSSPDGIATSGSTFAFSMFSDSGGTMPVLTTDTTDGFALTVDINLDGTTTFRNFSPETSITTVSATPDANSGLLVAIALALMCVSIPLRRRSPCRLGPSC